MTQNPEDVPQWLVFPGTVLIPKVNNSKDARKFRPIPCLPVIYKGFISLIATKIREYSTSNELIPSEQKGVQPTQKDV